MTTMKITMGDVTSRAVLLEKEAPMICSRMKDAMPLEGLLASAKIADKEITFSVPFFIDEQENYRLVEPGEIAFLNALQTICFFYGDREPLAPICVWARLTENLEGFEKEADKVFANQGLRIKMELEE